MLHRTQLTDRIGKLKQDQFAYENYTVIDTVIMGHAELWEVKRERDRIYSLPEMSDDEKRIYKCIQNEPLSFEEIANLTKFSTPELNSHLTMLILRGIIVKMSGNCYRVS